MCRRSARPDTTSKVPAGTAPSLRPGRRLKRSIASARSWRPPFGRPRSASACGPLVSTRPAHQPRSSRPSRRRTRHVGHLPCRPRASRPSNDDRTSALLAPISDTRLVLLGTKGGPRVGRGRANPANVVVVKGRPFVIDCGYGVTRQLIEAGIPPQQVRTILITHHHSDHILELGPLIYNVWACGLREPIDVWGPPPLRRIIDGFLQSMAYDIDIRIEDEGR